MDAGEAARWRISFCAICGESTTTLPATALLTVRAPAGQTGAFAAHGQCVIDIFHPTARAILMAAPVIPDPNESAPPN